VGRADVETDEADGRACDDATSHRDGRHREAVPGEFSCTLAMRAS